MAFATTSQAKTLQPMTSAVGQLLTASETPEVHVSAEYDTFKDVQLILIDGGTATIGGSEFELKSGANSAGFAAIASNRQVNGKPGQGSIIRINARFAAPDANINQIAGASTSNDSALFEYAGSEFGVSYGRGGEVQAQELIFTVTAGGAETADVTINGTVYPISFTATTLAQTAGQVAAQLNATVPNYSFSANGADVVIRSVFAAPSTGSFLYAATSGGLATGLFTQLAIGVARAFEFIGQASWNVNKMPVLDVLKNNTYSISFDGDVNFFIDDIDGPVLVHQLGYTNSNTFPMFSNQTFRLVWRILNIATPSATPSMFASKGGGFLQGQKALTADAISESNTKLAVGTTATNILTIRCRGIFGNKANFGAILPSILTGATDGNKGAIMEVYKNATIAGIPDFSYKNKSNSIAEIDTAGTDITGGELVASFTVLGNAPVVNLKLLNQQLLLGDTLTIGMRVTSGGGADMSVGLTWEEDL